MCSGNEQKQSSEVQNPDEIALDDDEDEEEEEDGAEEGEEGINKEIIQQSVPDEVFGKLAEKVYQD